MGRHLMVNTGVATKGDVIGNQLAFCRRLNDELANQLSDMVAVRSRVDSLLSRNSFRESCFTKGCVLPVVDTVATDHLTTTAGASRSEVRQALRCEGFDTPMYVCSSLQAGFSSHSRSNSYHPGSKSGRHSQSRRSPDFCIRHPGLRMVGEIKYIRSLKSGAVSQVLHELRDYLSIASEPTSDWGHDFGFGLIYAYEGDTPRSAQIIQDYWPSDRIVITVYTPS